MHVIPSALGNDGGNTITAYSLTYGMKYYVMMGVTP